MDEVSVFASINRENKGRFCFILRERGLKLAEPFTASLMSRDSCYFPTAVGLDNVGLFVPFRFYSVFENMR